MLNKLLKRCMPWMDKGRWYSIRVVGSDPSNLRTVFNSDEILSAEISISSGNPAMTVSTKHIPHIIDFKFCPENNWEYMILPNDVYIMKVDNNTFKIPLMSPGTLWFFMTWGR